MTLITFLLLLVVLGVAAYLIENHIPMSPPFKTVLRVVIVLALVFMLLSLFGLYTLPIRLR